MRENMGARKLLSVLLAVVLLLPTLSVSLPAEAALTDYGLQTYDNFEAKSYGYSNTEGIYGNGEARVISADYDHTTGSGKSVQITMNGYKAANMTAQTTVKAADGSHPQFVKGMSYRVTAWLLSPADLTVLYRISTVKGKQDVTASGSHKMELEETVSLTAGVWTKLSYEITVTGPDGTDSPYMTVGASNVEGVTDTNLVYLDDVQVAETYGLQTYDSFEAKSYGYSNTEGIYGNGEARVISADYDHTTGSGKSVQITMNGYKAANMTAQTTVKAADGSHPQFVKGTCYRVTAWLLSPADLTVLYRISTVKGKQDVTASGSHKMELEESVPLAAGVWTQVSYAIMVTGPSGTDSPYMTVGVSNVEGVTDTNLVYLDDVLVTEVDMSQVSNVQDYETMDVDDSVVLSGTGTVSGEQNHTVGGSRSAKILMNDQGGTARAQLLLRNALDLPVQVEMGKGYEISMWVYVDSTNATEPLNYWACSSATDTALTSKPIDYAEYDMVAKQFDMPTRTWTQITVPVEEVLYGSYLIFGVTTRTASSTNSRYIYIDDVTVTEMDFSGTVSTFEGGLLYTGGVINGSTISGTVGSAVYTVGDTQYTAMRVAVDYTCADNDPTRVRYGTDTWTVVGRGVLLNYSDTAGAGGIPTVDSYQMQNYITGDKLESYWSLKDNTLRYSVLVKNLNETKAEGLYLTYRSYMVITDGAVERTVYGNTVSDVTVEMLYNAATQQGVTVKWFGE